MGWVVESHLNCSASKRPAEWTLCTFDVINGSVLAGMGVVGIILNSLVLYIILIAKVTIGGKQVDNFCFLRQMLHPKFAVLVF